MLEITKTHVITDTEPDYAELRCTATCVMRLDREEVSNEALIFAANMMHRNMLHFVKDYKLSDEWKTEDRRIKAPAGS